jgi:hypothetical protein
MLFTGSPVPGLGSRMTPRHSYEFFKNPSRLIHILYSTKIRSFKASTVQTDGRLATRETDPTTPVFRCQPVHATRTPLDLII